MKLTKQPTGTPVHDEEVWASRKAVNAKIKENKRLIAEEAACRATNYNLIMDLVKDNKQLLEDLKWMVELNVTYEQLIERLTIYPSDFA